MVNLIRGEMYKLFKGKYIKTSLITSIIASLFIFGVLKVVVVIGVEPKVVVNGMDILRNVSGQFLFINFLFAILAAEFVAGDFEDYTINKSFSYGYGRNKVIVSKFIAFYIGSIIIFLVCTFIITMAISIKYGFVAVIDWNTVIDILKMILISFICNMATSSITCMIAIISRNKVLTILSAMGIYILDMIISFVSTPFSNILPFNIGKIAISQLSDMGIMTCTILSCVVTIFITMCVSLIYFKKRDIS